MHNINNTWRFFFSIPSANHLAAMSAEKEEVVDSPEVHFEPLVKLPPMELKTLEEGEEELFKMRAKLFRFDSMADPPQWKERGTGDVKLMQNKKSGNMRLIMRRDKTHKICANHFLTKEMKLMPSAGSDRAWVWTVQADYADEEVKVEQLAIRFKNSENAHNFKDAFEKCQAALSDKDEDELAQEMNKLKVESAQDSTSGQQESDKKEEKKTLQENTTKTETTTDPQISSKDTVATTEDNKPAETK